MWRFLFGGFLVLLMVSGIHAQEEWHLVDAQKAIDLFDNDVRDVSISPDGTMLVALNGDAICILTLATDQEDCFSFPDLLRGVQARPLFNPFAWSPDSQRITFSEDLYVFLNESDIWVFDVGSETFSNQTDDGIIGGLLNENTENAALDYLPTYAPDGDLYFFRSQLKGGSIGNSVLTIQHLASGEQTPRQVVDLSTTLPTFSVYYRPSVSPDGSQIVFSIQAPELNAPQNGLWLVDLTNGESRQLTTISDAALGMPKTTEEMVFAAANPVWVNNGSGIVFQSISTQGLSMNGQPYQNFFYADVETGEVRPLVDLTDFPDGAEAFEEDEDGNSAQMRLPREGAVSADGSTFVYLRYDLIMASAQIAVVPLPLDGSEPLIMEAGEYEVPTYTTNPVMSVDGKALLGGWLYTFE